MLLVVYHEEARIEECLRHHLPFFQTIIVVHDGPCSDATTQIAKSLGVSCWETAEREGYCEPLRGIAQHHAKQAGAEWGAVIDADEKWSPTLLKDLPRLCAQFDREGTTCAAINRTTIFLPDGSYPTRTEDLQARLFKLDAGLFLDLIHTNVHLLKGRMVKLPDDGAYSIAHINVFKDFDEKSLRYREIAERQLTQHEPGTWQHSHLLTVLGETA